MELGLVLGVALVAGLLGAGGAWGLLRRRTERGQESEGLPLATVAEHIPLAVLIYASDGRIRFANERASALLFAGESPVGKNFLQLLAHAPDAVREALLGATDSLFSLDHDGERETFQMLRREVELDGDLHCLLWVNQLTREVSRREIEVLKKVIRVISHELNNSLASMTSLVGSARYILAHPENAEKLEQVLEGIEARTTHLQHFLSEYAAVSKLPEPRPQRIDWAPLLERLGNLFPDVVIHTPPTPTGWFDESQIEQALINLLKNALESGGPASEVCLLLRKQTAGLELAVLDRGQGFSPDAMAHGLLPFYSTKPGGSGVGLALCREVIEGHGGSLRIKAREGGGSAVCLVLPFEQQRPVDKPSAALTLTRT